MTAPSHTSPRRRFTDRPRWQKLLAGAVAIALIALGAVFTIDALTDSPGETAERCRTALRDLSAEEAPRAAGDASRPAACEGLSDGEYDLLRVDVAVEDTEE